MDRFTTFQANLNKSQEKEKRHQSTKSADSEESDQDQNNKNLSQTTEKNDGGTESRLNQTQWDNSNEKDSEPLFTPLYENLNLTGLGDYQHFTLPRPQVRGSWCDDSECHYNNRGSISSTAELISNNSTTGRSSGVPNQICTPPLNIYDMNYPYSQNSTNTIYHNPYSYSSSHTSSMREDLPYASIKHNSSRMKIRQDNASPAVSNITASTVLSSSRNTMKRHHKSGDHRSTIKSDGNATIVRNGGTMSRSTRAANASTMYYTPGHDQIVVPVPVQACQTNTYCSSCSGPIPVPVPMTQLETIPEMCSLKTDPVFWNYNNNNNHHVTLKRNSSIGGFTLNGQPCHLKKGKMSKFCSSHKIALVVSTFSLLVTIGLVITLVLMKKKGMMEPM